MATLYQPCASLRTVAQSKTNILRNNIWENCKHCLQFNKISCDKCDLRSKLLDRYIDANIPVEFINKTISEFEGDKKLIKLYEFITSDLKNSFMSGQSYMLKGNFGVGKTYMSSLILKKVVEKGMSGLYTTLGDIVNVLIYSDKSTKFLAARELKVVDWLVIDEFDGRFMGSDSSGELFGRILESIARIRFQNLMPIILITNQPDPTKALGEQLGPSVSSLIAGYCVDVPVIGKDHRKNKGE